MWLPLIDIVSRISLLFVLPMMRYDVHFFGSASFLELCFWMSGSFYVFLVSCLVYSTVGCEIWWVINCVCMFAYMSAQFSSSIHYTIIGSTVLSFDVLCHLCVYTCLSSLRCSKKEAESQTLLELAEKTLRAHNRSDEIVSFTGASADGTSLSFKEQYRCLFRLVNIFLSVRMESNRMQCI